MVADIEESEEMDASELHARKLNANEVQTPQRSGNFIFPVANGRVKNLGVRTASENIHLDPETVRNFFSRKKNSGHMI